MFAAMVLHKNTKHTNKSSSSSYFLSGNRNSNKNDNNNHQSNDIDNNLINNNVNNDNSNNGNHIHNRNQRTFNASTALNTRVEKSSDLNWCYIFVGSYYNILRRWFEHVSDLKFFN
ncbi:hypothetical protein PV325_006556 [Microctonus aethiopoides]|nr:hypothetical protein PV325_006556 [Microctonus aethiopoides]KAK0094542.1 hypothetical protein PV326_010641 [Microctonus aethiopoides]